MNIEYMRQLLDGRKVKLHQLAFALNCTNQTIYNAFNGFKVKENGKLKFKFKHFTLEEALKIRKCLNMSDYEFKKAFGDEEWYELLR